MVGQMWGPDSRSIVTFSDLQLRATVWSLVEQKAIAQLRSPKLIPPKGVSLTGNKKFLALAERREGKDWVSIYWAIGEWKLINTFEVDTFDMQDLSWCKQDTSIMVYDSALEAKILVYSSLTGECLVRHNFQMATVPSGVVGLGIKSVCFSPNGMYCIAAFFESKMKLLHGISMKEIANLELQSQLNLSIPELSNLIVYREEQSRDNMDPNRFISQYTSVQGSSAAGQTAEQLLIKLPVIAKKDIQAFQ